MHKISLYALIREPTEWQNCFKRICEKPRYSLLVNKRNTEIAKLHQKMINLQVGNKQ